MPPAVSADAVTTAQLRAALAARDDQIAELQQAVIELANQQGPQASGAVPGLEAKLSTLEGQMLEQERTIRHTLGMMIEWIEADDASRAAA